MQLYGDYHTHTIYSHGRGTIEANILSAIDKGLKEIAITDHGFRHTAYNVRRSDFPFQRQEVERLRRKYPQIKILLGLETNLQGNNGRIDIGYKDIPGLDIIICGYHQFVLPPNPKQCFAFWLPNFWQCTFKYVTPKRIALNTDAYINAINRYPIDIISHPQYGIKIDVVAVAKEAKRLGTFLELNGKKVSMTDKEIEEVVQTGVGLIINSDAHHPNSVGKFDEPMSFVKRLGIPESQIVNYHSHPNFRNEREREKIKEKPQQPKT